jgi:DNA-3-methyladenine glycosylase II
MSPSHTHLSQDPVMKKLIQRCGEIEVVPSSTDHFTDLIDTIISQQLSIKAAATIFGRFKALLNKYPFDPQEVLDLDPERARGAGASYAKIRYAKNIAQAVKDGALELSRFHEMSDQEILAELVQIKGIGPWTAEMFLMFTLGRPDIFSYGDLGLRNAITKLYGIEGSQRQQVEELALTWAPYRTTASRYLWKSLDNA